MSKLTKADAKAHTEACRLLEQDVLTLDEKWFVLENWQESAQHVNSSAGAFFTPIGLARDFTLEISGRRIIDLCAGIGTLSFLLRTMWAADCMPEIVCIELNPAYAAVGRKILPEATWIVGSVFDLPDLGHFDCAISNPPFGGIDRGGRSGPRYAGKEFEYHVIDVAADLADVGAFIIPQMSAPYAYSGRNAFTRASSPAYTKFEAKTGVRLIMGVSIDTTFHKDGWRGVAPTVEIATADFVEAAARRALRSAPAPRAMSDQRAPQHAPQASLFEAAE